MTFQWLNLSKKIWIFLLQMVLWLYVVPGHGWPKNGLVRQSVSHTLSQVIGSTEIFRRSIFYIFLEENMDKAIGHSVSNLISKSGWIANHLLEFSYIVSWISHQGFHYQPGWYPPLFETQHCWIFNLVWYPKLFDIHLVNEKLLMKTSWWQVVDKE